MAVEVKQKTFTFLAQEKKGKPLISFLALKNTLENENFITVKYYYTKLNASLLHASYPTQRKSFVSHSVLRLSSVLFWMNLPKIECLCSCLITNNLSTITSTIYMERNKKSNIQHFAQQFIDYPVSINYRLCYLF